MKTILGTLVTLLAATSLVGCVMDETKGTTPELLDSESVYDTAGASETDAVVIDEATAPEPGADPSETDTVEEDLVAEPGDAVSKAKSKTFWISNPTGWSNMLRLTPTCSSGVASNTPSISIPITGAYSYSKSGSKYYLSYSCQNAGTATVTVKCSSGTPALSYWFYDC